MSKATNYSAMKNAGVLAAQEASFIAEAAAEKEGLPRAEVDAAKAVAIGTVSAEAVKTMIR